MRPPFLLNFALLLVQHQMLVALQPTTDLYEHLLNPDKYNKMIRPTPEVGGPSVVYLGLRLSQIIDVDEKREVISTQVWVEQEWVDNQLVWEPSNFDGVESLLVPAERLWRPDIVLYNNADGKYEITTMTRAEVFHNGTVRWMPPALFVSSCRIDVQFFPYDEQRCSMRFGSWTYDGSKVELRHHLQKYAPELNRPLHIDYAADLYDFSSMVEFEILSVSAICQDRAYQHSAHTYPEIIIHLRMRRRTIFYTVNLMMPCIAISILTIMTFHLPPECREKISLSITIFLSLTLFFLLISETVPSTSLAVPLIGKYLVFTIILITSSIAVTVMVLNVHFRSAETHTMRPLTRYIFLEVLPKILRLQSPRKNSNKPNLRCLKRRVAQRLGETTVCNDWAPTEESTSQHRRGVGDHFNPLAEAINHELSKNCCWEAQLRLGEEIRRAAEGTRFIVNHLQAAELEANIKEDWQFMAVVVDRLALWIFSVVGIICTSCIVFQSPPFSGAINSLSEDNLPTLVNLTSFNDSEMLTPIHRTTIFLQSN